jgi:hypothetical protein
LYISGRVRLHWFAGLKLLCRIDHLYPALRFHQSGADKWHDEGMVEVCVVCFLVFLFSLLEPPLNLVECPSNETDTNQNSSFTPLPMQPLPARSANHCGGSRNDRNFVSGQLTSVS